MVLSVRSPFLTEWQSGAQTSSLISVLLGLEPSPPDMYAFRMTYKCGILAKFLILAIIFVIDCLKIYILQISGVTRVPIYFSSILSARKYCFLNMGAKILSYLQISLRKMDFSKSVNLEFKKIGFSPL